MNPSRHSAVVVQRAAQKETLSNEAQTEPSEQRSLSEQSLLHMPPGTLTACSLRQNSVVRHSSLLAQGSPGRPQPLQVTVRVTPQESGSRTVPHASGWSAQSVASDSPVQTQRPASLQRLPSSHRPHDATEREFPQLSKSTSSPH